MINGNNHVKNTYLTPPISHNITLCTSIYGKVNGGELIKIKMLRCIDWFKLVRDTFILLIGPFYSVCFVSVLSDLVAFSSVSSPK